MAWNEPGKGDRDPWSGGGRRDDGPPDLDEVVRKLQDRLGRLVGGGGGRGRGGGAGGSPAGGTAGWIVVALAVAAFVVYQSAYVIQPAERGVVLRFGAYVATLTPGLHFRLPPPIERVERVDVDAVRTISHKATMLTRDENIVDIELAVQYKVKNVTDYLFKVRAPDATLRQATATAVREVIGTSDMDFVLTEGRNEIAARTLELTQQILDEYGAGLLVDSVNMQPAKPPEEVKAAFDDAIKAREDEQRLINEAEAYRNEVLPKARGAAARITEDARAYKEQVVARAQGETTRFLKLLAEYRKAPEVTRERLYIDAMEDVLAPSAKVLLDAKGSNSLMYLPLDKLFGERRAIRLPAPAGQVSSSSAESAAINARDRASVRQRGRR